MSTEDPDGMQRACVQPNFADSYSQTQDHEYFAANGFVNCFESVKK
jgi:hypothetical protein